MAEWSKAAVCYTVVRVTPYRRFKSSLLRQNLPKSPGPRGPGFFYLSARFAMGALKLKDGLNRRLVTLGRQLWGRTYLLVRCAAS